jgi:hypothetical protein
MIETCRHRHEAGMHVLVCRPPSKRIWVLVAYGRTYLAPDDADLAKTAPASITSDNRVL